MAKNEGLKKYYKPSSALPAAAYNQAIAQRGGTPISPPRKPQGCHLRRWGGGCKCLALLGSLWAAKVGYMDRFKGMAWKRHITA